MWRGAGTMLCIRAAQCQAPSSTWWWFWRNGALGPGIILHDFSKGSPLESKNVTLQENSPRSTAASWASQQVQVTACAYIPEWQGPLLCPKWHILFFDDSDYRKLSSNIMSLKWPFSIFFEFPHWNHLSQLGFLMHWMVLQVGFRAKQRCTQVFSLLNIAPFLTFFLRHIQMFTITESSRWEGWQEDHKPTFSKLLERCVPRPEHTHLSVDVFEPNILPHILRWHFSDSHGCLPHMWGWHWAGSEAGSQPGSRDQGLVLVTLSDSAPWGRPLLSQTTLRSSWTPVALDSRLIMCGGQWLCHDAGLGGNKRNIASVKHIATPLAHLVSSCSSEKGGHFTVKESGL